MIRVHKEQLDELGRSLGREQFEDAMIEHLHGYAPWHSEILGDAGLRGVIGLGIERARAHGVTDYGALKLYVELMVLFGSMFDTDPLLPWAGAVLRDPGIADEQARIDRLHQETLAYFEAVNGAEPSAPLDALRRIQRLLRERVPVAELLTEQGAIDTMRRIHPTFCAYVGEPRLVDLFRRGPEVAARLDLTTDGGVVLVTGMMFTIGHGFADDPLFPWVRATLRDPSLGSPAARVARLAKRAQSYLDHAVDCFERRPTDAAL